MKLLPTNFEEFLNEGASKKKVDANVIADRMMDANLGGHYLLRRYAEEVRALKRVSEYDVDQIVPDHLPGHLIYGLFKESIDEKYIGKGYIKNPKVGDTVMWNDRDNLYTGKILDFEGDLAVIDHMNSNGKYVTRKVSKNELFKESLNEAKTGVEMESGGVKAERVSFSGIKGWKLTVDSTMGKQTIVIPDSIGEKLFDFIIKNTK